MLSLKLTPSKLKKWCDGSIFLTLLFAALVVIPDSQAEVLTGKVTSIHGDVIELSLGSEKGIKSGDSGKVYYTITVGGKEKPIFIAKFRITHLSEKSSMAQIEEKTGEVKAGYMVEVAVVTGGELEVKSEPSGAMVHMDGKEVGRTPVVLSDIKMGSHRIRITKEGYEPYEVLEDIGVGRLKVIANLKKVVREGELLVQTQPSGATIYLDGRPVGTSPYEGKGLAAGKYAVRVTKEGYETWEKVEVIEVGKKVQVLALLKLEKGELEVVSVPSEAKVSINGKEIGETPLVLSSIEPGRHLINVLREGYEPFEEQIEVKPKDRKKVLASLRTKTGELIVRTEPLGAMIYLDGKPVGTSLYEGKKLLPGPHKVRVIKDGYETWEKDVTIETGSKVDILARLEEIDWTKRNCNAPILNIGDRWTYRNATGEVWTETIVDIKGDLYIMKVGGLTDFLAYDKKSMNTKFLIEKGHKQLEYKSFFRKLFDFPIFVGKKWKDTTTGRYLGGSTEYNHACEIKIEGIEEVTTPMGIYKAFKIYYKQTTLTPSMSSGWVRYWYAPVVKSWIKREVEKSPYWVKFYSAELISYHLK